MSGNAKLFEKYKKSNIFNTIDDEDAPLTERQHRTRNAQASLKNTQNDIFHTLETENSSTYIKPNIKNKYVIKHHQSDIFNINDIIQTPKKPTIKKFRNASNFSNCFNFMTDNEQYKIDIKEYTAKHRATKKIFNPDKYFNNEEASGRLYNQLYDPKRNPVLPNKNSKMMKSSANLFSNINLNEKKLFTERKKVMRRQFTNVYLNNENLKERKKLTEENIKGLKNHTFYKTKGFTYQDNNYCTDKSKYVQPNQIPGNSSKITKQMQLQSNIFGENNKNKINGDINIIKERIKIAQENDEDKPKKTFKKIEINKSRNQNLQGQEYDRNIWGAIHNNWEESNLDWKNTNTEIIFGKTFSGRFPKLNLEKIKEKEEEDAFQRKVKHLSDSGFKDTINESIKSKRNWKKVPLTERLNYSNLEQIDEVLNEIPDNVLMPDKKMKIIGNTNTTDFNGNVGLNSNYLNYKKYHKNLLNKNENMKKKEPKIKIMSGEDNKSKKILLNKTFTNNKIHDDYKIHDYIISYDSKAKSEKTNFDKFNENEVKLIFSKKGIHIYDIQKNYFDNGKYNTIKFKIRENEGEQILNEKLKKLEDDLAKKQYKISITKEIEKDKKKNLRGVVKNPFNKGLIMAEGGNNKNSKFKKMEPLQLKKNASFSKLYTLINHEYKK